MKDLVGLGWRPELAAGILSNLDRIDLVEVIAEDYVNAPARKRRSLKTLSREVPVVLHGVSLGMASTSPVDPERLSRMARLIEEIRPRFWSEHLAFVRAGGWEIGHLAMPPRNSDTIDGAAANLERAFREVGARPLVENIATLIEPPSRLSEADWVSGILQASGCGLLLDLHNLYANAVNFDFDPSATLDQLPADKISAIHISGGRWIDDNFHGVSRRRLLDDHFHPPPDPVYRLLEQTAARAEGSLSVIIERDGNYPPINELLEHMELARAALGRGRCRREQEAAVA